jgi:ech hydrogenase subunit A
VNVILFLILAPLAAGLGLLGSKPASLRSILVVGVTLSVCVATVALALARMPLELAGLPVSSHAVNDVMLALELGMAGYVVCVGARARQPLIVALMVIQAGVMTWFELERGGGLEVERNFLVDRFSVIMALINGLVGSGIFLYALGYMREYHEVQHTDVPDRRPLFFGPLSIFMAAMFGVIFSNNLVWLFFFWEVTTLCSFVLIGYTGQPEARRNALKALVMNLAGGVAFALAIVWFHHRSGSIELQTLLGSGHAVALVPAALLCFAGITKSAQLPFSGWLLGAMVAPTPVSALLHSSTMVKAGVYLVLRLAPVLMGTAVGVLVALVGALTFVVGSCAAISTSNAKRVLAYSTVANLGLIVLCGGIGTYEAVWAGILLIIFHAVAKCLLFLGVGVVEHRLHSRDIEAMSGLILRLPRVTVMLLIGMAGMFLTPFGMLISKWAVLKAVVDACPPLVVFIAFGSAATLFFWVKWMGKLVEVVRPQAAVTREFGTGEAVALYGLSAATLLTCLFFPLISSSFVEPHVMSLYGRSAAMSHGNVVLMMIMMALVMLFPLSFINYGRRVRVTDAYLGGANVEGRVQFRSSAGVAQDLAMNNYYLGGLFKEARLGLWGRILGAGLLVLLVLKALL